MPTPSATTIQNEILADLPTDIFVRETDAIKLWTLAIDTGVAQAWAAWEAGLTGGENDVSGEGTPDWEGTGAGSSLTEGTAFEADIQCPFERETNAINQLIAAIDAELQAQFSTYASTYVFGTVAYVGSSTASDSSDGTFTATNTPASIGSLKASATTPHAIASGIEGRLTKPPFDLESPRCFLPQFLLAVEETIIDQFSIWESSSMFAGDTVEGPSATSTGEGTGTSDGTGTIS